MRAVLLLCVASGGCFTKPAPFGGTSSARCTTWSPWTTPMPLTALNTMNDRENGAHLSPDRTDIWFSREFMSDIFHATRPTPAQPFSMSMNVTSQFPGGPNDNSELFISDDGLHAWYEHFQGTIVIVSASREATTQPFANNLFLKISHDGEFHSGDASVTSDELTIVLAKWATISGPADLMISTRATDIADFADPPVQIANVNSVDNDSGPTISGDGLELIFASGRSGDTRLYRTTRASRSGDFAVPEQVEGQPEGGADNSSPVLSRDGTTLIFSSTLTGMGDLYEMTRECDD